MLQARDEPDKGATPAGARAKRALSKRRTLSPTIQAEVSVGLTYLDAKKGNPMDWDEAIRIYDVGLKQFRDNTHLQLNRENCVNRKK